MSEPNQTTIASLTAELNVLRHTNAELLKKSSDRKQRIAELVASTTELQGKLTAAETALYDATVGAPLRQMAADVLPVPELWIAEFSRHFKVEFQDGKLAVLATDGTPALLNGAPVEFSRQGLTSLLTKSANAAYKAFDTVMFGSRASGGASTESSTRHFGSEPKPKSEQAEPPLQFGLR